MITVSQACEDFLLASHADGLKEATIKWYRSLLNKLCRVIGHVPINKVTATKLRQYIKSLYDQKQKYVNADQRPVVDESLSEETVRSHIRALHRVWNWFTVEYDLEQNPMTNIKRPARIEPKVKAISDEDSVKLFDATSDDIYGIRDRAILAFLADTGCRSGGILSLELERLNLEEKYAIVYEKYDKKRKVFFTKATKLLLQQWLLVRPKHTNSVFVSMNTGEALTNSGLNQVLRRLKKRAGVTGHTYPHSFRHAFARSYLKNGGDLATLSRLLGHGDISVTSDYYAIFDDDELSDAHSKHSPIDNNLDLSSHMNLSDDDTMPPPTAPLPEPILPPTL